MKPSKHNENNETIVNQIVTPLPEHDHLIRQHLCPLLLFWGLMMGLDAVYAETAKDVGSSEIKEIEEIIVTGTRAQLRNAIAQKRITENISDSVTEDDVGNLPDFNAAEALSRIPGVSVESDQAEGRYISIRGLNANFNNTTIDGASVSSTDINGRRIEMDVVPASIASSIQVIKSLSADMDANAIGGTINFVSRSPFDYDDGFFSVAGAYGFYQYKDGYRGSKPSGNADAVWSKIFGADETFGIVLSTNYYRRASYLGRIEQGDEILYYAETGQEYKAGSKGTTTLSDGTTRPNRLSPYESNIHLPEEWKALQYHNDRQRYGGSFKFEWRPHYEAKTWIRGYYNEASDSEARMETKMWNRASSARVTFDTPTTGVLNNTEWSTQLGRFDFNRTTWGVKLAGRYVIAEDFIFEPSINRSGSSYEQPQVFDRFKQKQGDFSFDTSNRITHWAPTTGDAFNASLFDYEKRELNTDRLDQDVTSFVADLGWNNQADDVGFGLKAGFKHKNKTKEYDYERTEYRFGDGLGLQNIEFSRSCPANMPSCTNDMFITMDIDSIDKLAAQFLGSNETSLRTNEDDDNLRDYKATEKITALYLLGAHSGENHHAKFGLRWEGTKFSSSGKRDDKDLREFVPTSNENNYNNWLMSFNFRYDLTQDIILRSAFSQSASRPRLSYQAARGESIDLKGSELFITRGNSNLKPRTSDNFDLGLEWYFDEGSLLSLAGFYKMIDNQIYRTTRDTEMLYDQDGDGTEELTSTQIREYINGEKNHIWGVEFGYSQELTKFIPGLGFNINATILDTKWDIELENGSVRSPKTFIQQTKFTANGLIYYQNGNFEARIAINHTGLKLNNLYTSNEADTYRDQYDKARTQVDAQLRYDFSDQFGFYINGLNIFSTNQYEVFGLNQEFNRWESVVGRAIFVGIAFRR